MTTRDNGATDRDGKSLRLWPFRRGTAMLASLGLMVVLLLELIGLRQANVLPDDQISAWLLLGAALLSLAPMFLSVLDRAAESAGTVEARASEDLILGSGGVGARGYH